MLGQSIQHCHLNQATCIVTHGFVGKEWQALFIERTTTIDRVNAGQGLRQSREINTAQFCQHGFTIFCGHIATRSALTDSGESATCPAQHNTFRGLSSVGAMGERGGHRLADEIDLRQRHKHSVRWL